MDRWTGRTNSWVRLLLVLPPSPAVSLSVGVVFRAGAPGGGIRVASGRAAMQVLGAAHARDSWWLVVSALQP